MRFKSITIVMLCLFSMSVAAESMQGSHCFVGWVNGGVSTLIGSTPRATIDLGGGGGLGVGYEWRGHRLLVQTGLGARYSQYSLRFGQNIYDVFDQVDSEGWRFNYQYVENNRRDTYNQLTAQIPIMVGVHYNQFYFLAGAKLGANVYNASVANGVYSTRGIYDQFDEPLEDMPNHRFYNQTPLQNKISNPINFNVAASVELGGEITLNESRNEGASYLRIAAFADFNVLDERTKSSTSMIQLLGYSQLTDIQLIKPVDYLHSNAATNAVRNMMAGVKVTFVLATDTKYGCIICKGGYPTRRDMRRGSRMVR